jgi:hypothetical protein
LAPLVPLIPLVPSVAGLVVAAGGIVMFVDLEFEL